MTWNDVVNRILFESKNETDLINTLMYSKGVKDGDKGHLDVLEGLIKGRVARRDSFFDALDESLGLLCSSGKSEEDRV